MDLEMRITGTEGSISQVENKRLRIEKKNRKRGEKTYENGLIE